MSFAEGSALIETGRTRVICTASVEDRVPSFLKGSGTGWITAEYAMLPRATLSRTARDSALGRISGRSHEIQRFIGRILRSVVDLSQLGEHTVVIDCDVIQADGGTRTAAVTGSYVALHQALESMASMGIIAGSPLAVQVAAISVGIIKGNMLLDMCYEEDSQAEVDFNIALTSRGDLAAVEAAAELKPFSKDTLAAAITLAEKGIEQLIKLQKEAIDRLEDHYGRT